MIHSSIFNNITVVEFNKAQGDMKMVRHIK